MKSLGVILDSNLTLRPQVNEVVRQANYAMITIRKALPSLPTEYKALVVGMLVNSHLDYANSLYVGLPEKDLQRLQKTQNQAIPLTTGLKVRTPCSNARRNLQ